MAAPHKIGNVTAGFMIALAASVDVLQALLTFSVVLLPFSLFLSFLSFIVFGLWFLLLGAYSGQGSSKRLMTSAGAMVIEIVPFLSMLPATTAGVLSTIVQTRVADSLASRVGTDPRKLQAVERLQRQKAAQRQRADSMRSDREQAQEEKHSPANDNEEGGSLREAA